MTTKPSDIGPNRTGTATSPARTKEAIEGAEQGVANPSFDLSAHHAWAVDAAQHSSPLGTVPIPATLKGAATTAKQVLKGHAPGAFLDLLADRLAFERTGVRLYEALLCRYDAANPKEGSPTRAQLEHIRNEELEHFQLLVDSMQGLGADPTAMTPAADATGVIGCAYGQVLSDPRTTFTEGLMAILQLELADNDAWNTLAHLAAQLGMEDMAEEFKEALEEENEHLASVRAWLNNSIQGQLGFSPQAVAPAPDQPQPGA